MAPTVHAITSYVLPKQTAEQFAQDVETAVANVEAVAAELNVPVAHALHTRSAVAFEATL